MGRGKDREDYGRGYQQEIRRRRRENQAFRDFMDELESCDNPTSAGEDEKEKER